MLQPVPLPADIESMAWDPFQSNHLYCSLEDGQVMCVDIRLLGAIGNKSSRAKDAIILQFPAHDKTVSSMDFSSTIPGLCATSSIDETVKIWDMHAPASTSAPASSPQRLTPKNVFYKTMNVGNLFSINFSKDDPFLLATGGDGGIVAVWDCDEQQVIKDYFEGRELKKISSAAAAGGGDLKLESLETEEGAGGEGGEEDGMELVKKSDAGEGGSEGKSKKKKKSKKKTA
jgi:WD40 repeat protein